MYAALRPARHRTEALPNLHLQRERLMDAADAIIPPIDFSVEPWNMTSAEVHEDTARDLFKEVRQMIHEECAEIALESVGTWKDEELQAVAQRTAERIAEAIRQRGL